jgi:hypothetical protein
MGSNYQQRWVPIINRDGFQLTDLTPPPLCVCPRPGSINLDIGQFDTNKNKCTHRMEDYVSHEETNKTDSN